MRPSPEPRADCRRDSTRATIPRGGRSSSAIGQIGNSKRVFAPIASYDSARLSLRAAATERDVRHGMEFPQGCGLHTSLTSGFISDVGIVVEELSRDLHAGWMGEDRPSR